MAIFIPFLVIVCAAVLTKYKNLRIKVWAFNMCFICSILFNAEVVFKYVYSSLDVPNLYELRGSYYFNKPYLEQKFNDPEFVSYYKTNCQGYRIDEMTSPDIHVGSCDWMFIGDSFTQGAQVNYDKLYSTLVYRYFPNKIIVNAGISGAGLYDELNYFKDKGHLLKPKKVFLQIGSFNDFMNVVERHPIFQDYLVEYSSLYRYFKYNASNSDELPLGRWTEPFFPYKPEFWIRIGIKKE